MIDKAGRAGRKAVEETLAKPSSRVVIEGQIVKLQEDGRVRLQTSDGPVICRLAHGIDRSWLRAALALGPVEAEGTRSNRGGSVWALFPGPEHATAVADQIQIAAATAIDIACGQSTITLKNDGRVRVRGRDVGMRGAWVARIQGRTVRVN